MAIGEFVGLALKRVGQAAVPEGEAVELPGRGTTFVYRQEGPPGAPVLFLLHGLAATAALNWFPAFPSLSGRFGVVAMDMRGHGRGVELDGRFRLADCADDTVALADVLGVEHFVPVGYSLGGPVAQLVWHRHRDRVEGLVLCATSRNFGGTLQERLFYRLLPALSAAIKLAGRGQAPDGAIAEVGAALGFGPDAMLSRWALSELGRVSPSVMLQACNAMGRFSSHAWIGDVDVPTAVVVTTADRFISPARQLKLARAIEGATLHPVHANHAACVLGHRRFVPALVEACESVAGRLHPRELDMKGGAWNA